MTPHVSYPGRDTCQLGAEPPGEVDVDQEPNVMDRHDKISRVYVPALKKARTMILVVGILYAVSGIIYYFLLEGKIDPRLLNIILAINLVLCVIHIGLWIWAKKAPLAASVVALVLFVTLHLVNAIRDPSSIHMGIIIKVIFIVLLVQGIRAGLETRRLLSEGASGQGSTD